MSISHLLVLDAAPAAVRARVGAFQYMDGTLHAVTQEEADGHDGIAAMAVMAERCLAATGWDAPDLVVTVVGPGSFTGLRTSCALAAGLAFGFDCPTVGVTRGEALSRTLDEQVRVDGLTGWLCVTTARRGRWFVEDASGNVQAVASAHWQPPEGRWLLAGDAAEDAALAAPDRAVKAAGGEASLAEIARYGWVRGEGSVPWRAALPLYVDAPEAKLPAAGLRSEPV
ncbi:peptidase [Acetobacter estunensis NRIC 0472]|uniref:tRNA (adenosine(37)-N6)-threonylcarbamoyltransferase complex dimerization subunit type 1 TsaB n=1 Tax=Acetobacter estunensis TaxID=104097 RepID=UPI002156E8B0|nr:tRNA (adenosine(37)-N6)-threonylcarbamoyltransferase complex dimerization subunit type 1 TsaB [Acetobacter estunensis]GBQ24306.1 peptidase [Acetobacter estunensis NRIC 0472]